MPDHDPGTEKPAGPDDRFERAALQRGCRVIAGVDEVGRGPWAGPVSACAVILDLARLPPGLNDSKKLSASRRQALARAIAANAQVGIAHVDVAEIDAMNILEASHEAMRRAVRALPSRPDHLLIDGNRLPADLPCPGECIVKGDGRSASIAAASIMAKVARDALMVELAQHYPGYGWEHNAGYGTKMHQAALHELGVTPHHRRSFKPIHNILYQAK